MNALQEIPYRLAENAAFLWLQHKNALSSSDYDLADIEELEQRIDAQIDGMQAYGDEAWDACEEALSFEEDGEVFAAATMAFTGKDGKRIKQVLDVGFSSPENYHALQSALAWFSFEDVQLILAQLLKSTEASHISLGVSCCALHRRDCGEVLKQALENAQVQAEPLYFSRVLRAVGELNRKDLLVLVNQYREHDDIDVAFWASWSSVMLGDKTGFFHVKPFVFEESPYLDRALNILLRSLPAENARGLIQEFSKDPKLRRNLIKGLGIVGDAASLPWLIAQMKDDKYARLAGESFSMITGLNFHAQNMVLEQEEHLAQSDDEDTEGDGALDEIQADDGLLHPHYKKVDYWFKQNRQQFQSGQRYILGKPVTVEHCMQVVRTAFQKQRLAAGCEVIVSMKDRPIGGGVYEISRRACLSA